MPQGTSGARHTRRALLVGCSGLAAAVLSGCDIRVERGGPHIPGVPTRTPPPDTHELRAVLRRIRTVAQVADRVEQSPSPTRLSSSPPTTSTSSPTPTTTPATWAARLATIHHQQATRLAGVIRTSGVTAPPPSSATGSATTRRLRELETTGVAGTTTARLSVVSRANLPMLGAIAATQGAAAIVLGASPTWPESSPAPDAILPLLASVRSCVYALEEVAARTPLPQRTVISATLTTMYAARSRLVAAAGSSAPPPPVDYRLPVRVTDTASGRRLVQTMLGRVVTTCAARSSHAVGQVALLDVIVRLWSEATAQAWIWGVQPAPFPGLRT